MTATNRPWWHLSQPDATVTDDSHDAAKAILTKPLIEDLFKRLEVRLDEKDSQINALKRRASALEARLGEKDSQINALKRRASVLELQPTRRTSTHLHTLGLVGDRPPRPPLSREFEALRWLINAAKGRAKSRSPIREIAAHVNLKLEAEGRKGFHFNTLSTMGSKVYVWNEVENTWYPKLNAAKAKRIAPYVYDLLTPVLQDKYNEMFGALE